MNITMLSTAISVVVALGGGGYWFANELNDKASKDEVKVVGTKAEYGLDKHQEYTLTQINKLQSKRNKTPDDLDQLRYLRDELKRLRELRKGS